MSGHLDAIVQLHHTLTDLYAARERLHGIPDWMRELHEEHESAQAAIAELEEAIAKAREERRAAEAQVEEARELQKRYQKQINEVSTQREYGALLHEIDTVKQQINEGEELALAAMERADAVTAELASTKESSADLSARYEQELEKWEAEKPAVAEEVAQLEEKAEALRSDLPPGVVRQFDRIAERLDGPPLAAIRRVERPGRGPNEWHCGQCNYRVRPQVVVDIRNNGTMVQCESCKRILYVEDEA
jgi:predicted  nucleic acid-binding Zn-ribbon protein